MICYCTWTTAHLEREIGAQDGDDLFEFLGVARDENEALASGHGWPTNT